MVVELDDFLEKVTGHFSVTLSQADIDQMTSVRDCIEIISSRVGHLEATLLRDAVRDVVENVATVIDVPSGSLGPGSNLRELVPWFGRRGV
jgi:hypothetical protein